MGPIYRLLVGVGEAHVPNIHIADQWNEAGYALVFVDARGSGASTGERPVEWSDAEVADMGEVTEWITSQPWSNGAVGCSRDLIQRQHGRTEHHAGAPGASGGCTALQRLRPQFFLTMPGGVYNRAFVEAWNDANQSLDKNDICALEEVDGWDAGGSSSRCPG